MNQDEIDEVTARVARVRQLCDDLDKALKYSADQRALIQEVKRDVDATYRALTKEA